MQQNLIVWCLRLDQFRHKIIIQGAALTPDQITYVEHDRGKM